MPTITKPSGEDLLEEILSRPRSEEAALEPRAEPEEEEDLARLRQRKPPSRGLCRRCGENKPINRLMLCYACWVKTNLEEHDWREGQPHPDWCQCEGLPGHAERRSSGN